VLRIFGAIMIATALWPIENSVVGDVKRRAGASRPSELANEGKLTWLIPSLDDSTDEDHIRKFGRAACSRSFSHVRTTLFSVDLIELMPLTFSFPAL
jgi:hypothetical protein